MTRKEFSSKSEALSRASRTVVVRFFIWMFALLVAGEFASSFVQRYTHFSAKQWNRDGSILLMALFFGGFAGLVYLGFYRARKSGLFCRNCGHTFVEKIPRIVLFTGHCPKCKSAVFREATETKPKSGAGLTYEEFKVKFETAARRAGRRTLISLAVIFTVMAAFVPLVKYFADQLNRGKLDQVVAWAWVERRRMAEIVLSLFGLLWLSLFFFLGIEKLKPGALPCPECGRSLMNSSGKVALSKGMCVFCGCHLFDVPSVKPNAPCLVRRRQCE